ncbi:SDR family NAD(P)-dependent oxidoreductase [Stenomitos frigidus]|uniref:Dehydrogenase n=1 Tax=Stenomitos frigidus ULC18 TaxID=2107698 RepID=A0A2T1ECG7_9CYAN|nr:glucose 1-dehydrogenase [Stenomitos frigidus]PSB30404.1 dehydrogenase [Stenomitos frigidus ULC18]
MGRLDGKVALITGVASGIGRSATELFMAEGANVFGVDRNEAAGQSLTKTLNADGRFQFFAADLSVEAACAAAINHCHNTYGRIDVLYNNAGIAIIEPFASTNAETLEQVLSVNFKSVFYLCQQVIPHMQRQGSGVVINTASELAIVAQPLYAAYCASKGAVLSLTRALALEYARENIRINALCPGPIETPMLQGEFDQAADPAQAKAEGIATMPIGRLGNPVEIAQVALFLASDAPALLHGSALVVDGGKTIL